MKFLDALLPTATRSHWLDQISWTYPGGQAAVQGFTTTYGNSPAEPVGNSFQGYIEAGLYGNGVVYGLEQKRVQVFSQARIAFQQMRKGRPDNLFSTPELQIFETPWPGGTTGDLLSRMLLDADAAGNAFNVLIDDEVVRLRPDWVEIILAPRYAPMSIGQEPVQVGYKQLGIFYYEDGIGRSEPAVFLKGEYSHFAPMPDPLASYRGMSWLTPVIRELQADTQATKHKLKFFENAATPNVAVSLPKELTPEQFRAFKKEMDVKHAGVDNAYKTLYTGGGADVTVIGTDMKQLDFRSTQGAGETRLALAAGVHPVVAGLSEGMQGSSLNAGNYNSAKRQFVDTTVRHLWQSMAGSLGHLITPPSGSRLWYDARDIPFLLDDMRDRSEIQFRQAQSIRSLGDAGWTPESIKLAIEAEDWTYLEHSGVFSVQLQPPTTQQQNEEPGESA